MVQTIVGIVLITSRMRSSAFFKSSISLLNPLPMDDVSLLVSQGHGAKQEPAILPVSPAETCLSLKGFPMRHSGGPLLPQTVIGMEYVQPSPAQTVLHGKARIFQKISV